MNMKKTIAAVAACAMAVSAMATTVSAVDEGATEAKSVHYDLTIKEKAKSASLTFVGKGIAQQITELKLTIPFTYVTLVNQDVNVTVADKSTKTSYTFTFTSNSSSSNYDGTTSLTKVDTTGGTTPNAWEYKIDLANPALAASIAEAFNPGADGLDITLTMANLGLVSDADQGKFTADIVASKCKLEDNNNTVYNGKGVVSEADVKKPMKTIANTTSNTAEIFARLATKGTKDKDNGYKNVSAVINDMVANYDDVVFTFNTATDNVISEAWLAGKESWIGNAVNFPGYYVTNVPGTESWMGDSQFKSFPQHLYNLFGDEGTGYTYSDSYAFNNLFNAALVANNGYTMNQSTVTPFEYSKTSVSFSWSDLTGGNSFVSPASAVQTLQLATSSEWYWDSMDVAAYVLAADDASTDAGIEDDGADLDEGEDAAEDDTVADDDAADDVADDDVADDDVADDVADDDVAADDTVADDTTDANPATGNAPIALAVIPVALAAAAVVAKKRG